MTDRAGEGARGCGGAGEGSGDRSFEDKVRDAIATRVRPMLVADGGDIEIVGISGKTVTVRLRGACCGCPHAAMTLKRGVEEFLRHYVDRDILVENAAP
ncbi:MAG: NifU family protein [Planctomycetota bacterium]|nr:NifU family protein [Planctomycetota bacterium]